MASLWRERWVGGGRGGYGKKDGDGGQVDLESFDSYLTKRPQDDDSRFAAWLTRACYEYETSFSSSTFLNRSKFKEWSAY